MNEDLKRLLSTLRIDGNIRIRLKKIFDEQEPVTQIDLRGFEHDRKLLVSKEDAVSLIRICKEIENLEMFAIVGRNLDQETMDMLAESIREMTKLRILNIEGETIEYSIEMQSVLIDHPSIADISLYSDQLEEVCVESITRVLNENKRITSLSIGGNQTKEETLQNLIKYGAVDQLEQFAITCKSLSLDSCRFLGEYIARSAKLTGVLVEAGAIEGRGILLERIAINPLLTSIDVFDDSLKKEEAERLEGKLSAIVERNKSGESKRILEQIFRLSRILLVCHGEEEVGSEEAVLLIMDRIGKMALNRREMVFEEGIPRDGEGGGGAGADHTDGPGMI